MGAAVLGHANFVPDLPVLYVIWFGMAVLGPQLPSCCFHAAIAVFDFSRRIFGLLAGPSHADERLGPDIPAESNELVDPNEILFQPAPDGGEGLPFVPRASAGFPIVVFDGAAPEANDARVHGFERRHYVRTPES